MSSTESRDPTIDAWPAGGCVVVHRPDRRVLRFTGERAASALNGLLTADLSPLADGGSVYTLVLTPKGRILAEGTLVTARDELWFDLPAVSVDPILEHFGRYLPPRFARFSIDLSLRRVSLLGSQTEEAYARWTGSEVPAGIPDGCAVATRPAWQGGGLDLFLHDDPSALQALEAACASRDSESDGFDAWRISRGLPSYGTDIGPDSLPQETGLDLFAINYEKGCYTGQEVVARIHYRGHVNRFVRVLRANDTLPPEGPLYFEGREVGRITSIAPSAAGGSIALATVRREVAPGSTVALESGGKLIVEVHEQPFTVT